MTWNYRLTKWRDVVAVREVYYNDYNEVVSWTDHPVSLSGETRKEVVKDIRRITECLREPVIDLDHIEKRRDMFKVLDNHLNNGCTDDRCTLEPEPGKDEQFSRRLIEHLVEEITK